jgi:hypothetical protein
MGRIVLPLAVLLLAACSIVPTPTAIGPPDGPGPSVPELAAGTVTEDGITLSVTAEPAVVRAGAPIAVRAVLEHDRPDPLIVSGSGSGIVSFSVTRLEDGLTSGLPAMTSDCVPHELPPGAPLVVPFSKSGGSSPDDPNADFLELYFADPDLTLPAGAWRIDVATHGLLGEGCDGPPLQLEVSLVVTVTD